MSRATEAAPHAAAYAAACSQKAHMWHVQAASSKGLLLSQASSRSLAVTKKLWCRSGNECSVDMFSERSLAVFSCDVKLDALSSLKQLGTGKDCEDPRENMLKSLRSDTQFAQGPNKTESIERSVEWLTSGGDLVEIARFQAATAL